MGLSHFGGRPSILCNLKIEIKNGKVKRNFLSKKVECPTCRVVGRANNNANANGGLVYANAFNASSNSYAYSGSRLAFKNEELAEYAAKQFGDIYADFCFIPKASVGHENNE